MIAPAPGILLVADPFLQDPNFKRTVVFLCEHQEEGSFGFVLNRPYEYMLADLVSGVEDLDIPVFYGGPVQIDTVHFLHQVPDQIPGGFKVVDDVYWGGDFELLLGLIGSGAVGANEVRLFAGYSGWSAGQLAGEMQGQSWIRHSASAGKVFTLASDAFWRDILREKGGRFKVLANYPVDPRLN